MARTIWNPSGCHGSSQAEQTIGVLQLPQWKSLSEKKVGLLFRNFYFSIEQIISTHHFEKSFYHKRFSDRAFNEALERDELYFKCNVQKGKKATIAI